MTIETNVAQKEGRFNEPFMAGVDISHNGEKYIFRALVVNGSGEKLAEFHCDTWALADNVLWAFESRGAKAAQEYAANHGITEVE